METVRGAMKAIVKGMMGIIMLVVFGMFVLIACGDTEVQEIDGQVSQSSDTSVNVSSEGTSTDSTIKDLNNQIVNDESINASLVNIEYIEDEFYGKQIKVKFLVENKTNETITVQAREVSTDGMMVDETVITMSQDISPGKKANCILTIHDFEGYEFPTLNSNFEALLRVFDEDYDIEFEYPVNVTF